VGSAFRSIGLVGLAICVGTFAWTGDPRTIPLSMGFPLLWSQARPRAVAVLVSAAYFLAASRGLPQGVANYYGANGLLGFVLWLTASSAFVLVFGALWSRQGWQKPFRFGIAVLVMSVPPFGIVGWASPITAAGMLFPGGAWFGLALCFGGLLALTTPKWPVPLAIMIVLWATSAATWAAPSAPPDWVGVDTHFRGVDGQYAGYDQERQTIALVQAALARGFDKILLPESALGIWTPTVEHLWTDALRRSKAIVVGGAVVVDDAGYDNVMIELTAKGGRILYHERMPVPVSMWQPWLSWIGQVGGARADFFANPVVSSGGGSVAVLICYEQLLVWPILQSMLQEPKLILAGSDGWWTEGTNILEVQEAVTTAWARLYSVPIVTAINS
jgi:hypothetical protein